MLAGAPDPLHPRRPSSPRYRRRAPSPSVEHGIVLGGSPPIGGAANGLGMIEGIAFQRGARRLTVIDRHDLKRGATSVDHDEPRSLAHALNELRQGAPQLLGVDGGADG